MSQHTELNDYTSGEEQDEPTPLEYARQSRITLNYLEDTTELTHLDDLRSRIEPGLTDDSHLVRFSFGDEFNVEERLPVPKAVAQSLASLKHIESLQAIHSEFNALLDSRQTRRMKLDLPLLRSDHRTDCEDFARRDCFEIKLEDILLPLELVKEDANEGLTFPQELWGLGEQTMKRLAKERLAVAKDTVVYLQETLRKSWTPDDEIQLLNSLQVYQRKPEWTVTPPLTPLRSPPRPYELEFPLSAYEVPFMSDPPSLCVEDLKTIEMDLIEQDQPTPLRTRSHPHRNEDTSSETFVSDVGVTLGEIYSPLASLDGKKEPPMEDIPRSRISDLKVEVPLTPPKPKAVRFNHVVEELDIEPRSLSVDSFDHSKFFDDAFGDAYTRATKMSEQEKLVKGAEAYVTVPSEMDFSHANAPWKTFQHVRGPETLLSAQKFLIGDIVGERKLWPGAKQGHTKLNWMPFPHELAKVALEEQFDQNIGTWESFVKGPENDDVIDSSNLTWKPDGLRILKEEDDEDDLEQATFLKDQPKDMSFLVKKRKLLLEASNPFKDVWNQVVDPDAGSITDGKERTRKDHGSSIILNQVPNQKYGLGTEGDISAITKQQEKRGITKPFALPVGENVQLDRDLGSLLSGDFAAEQSVDNFLEMRGKKKAKLSDRSHFTTELGDGPPGHQNPQQLTVQLPIRKSPVVRVESLPVPSFIISNTPLNIIVSTTIIRNRALIKVLENTLPTLNIIERDFSAHNTTAWMPGSVSRSPIASVLDSEADLILSPLTGVLLTTLQKIKQKPLPGHKGKSAIRERLDRVSVRYEHLIVLVSEDRLDETTNGLANSDCVALTEFIGVASGSASSISVQFVGGGTETLAKWLMGLIVQHNVREELISDETHWELFLRRSGMNAFSAQSVIAALKAPDGVNANSPTKAGHYGLTAFVEMGDEVRVTRFKHFCGMKVLERVGRVINARWDFG